MAIWVIEMQQPDPVNSAFKRTKTDPKEINSTLGPLLNRMSKLLEQDQKSDTSFEADVETESTLRLALIAMSEAEKRIERQQQRIEHLESLSITDELTNIMNRRGFMIELRRSLVHATRENQGGSIVMVDLDHFKKVNDTLGHAAGDALLQNVGQCLKHRVRETDVVGRLGGDEFGILMPSVDPETATHRTALIEREMQGRCHYWKGVNIPIYASLGLAHYTSKDSETSIMERVDFAMYTAKRNRQTVRE